jgi:phosphatidylglycerophosphatase A
VSQLPNILSFLRLILLIPIVFFLTKNEINYLVISFILFSIGVLTDFADGYIARRIKSTSKLGAFLDPLLDKLFTLSLFFVFYLEETVFLPLIFLIVFILREYFITLIRVELLVSEKSNLNSKKKSFKTSFIGKLKLSIQALVLFYFYILIFLSLQYDTDIQSNVFKIINLLLLLFSSYLLIASAIDYIKTYRDEAYKVYVKSFATVFYIGHFKFVPGGVTAFITAIVLYFLDIDLLIHVIATIVITFIGIYFSFLMEKIVTTKDPRIVTIDEMAGVMVATIPAFFVDNEFRFYFFIFGFILFGLLDKFKPSFINKAQGLKGGWGVVLDDILAGIIAGLILLIAAVIINL